MITPVHLSWYTHLQDQFADPRMQHIKQAILDDRNAWITVYPWESLVFNALNLTPLDQVKVVILGQDPYHGLGQAHGLSFSVPEWVAIPPSLSNIFKAIHDEFQTPLPSHGDLTNRAHQWVFLINSMLTVQASRPLSHQHIGRQWFTDRVIEVVSEQTDHTVFMLWGAYAQSKQLLIDASRHLILKAPHPSPLSAYRWFVGCRHFQHANDYLLQQGKSQINW